MKIEPDPKPAPQKSSVPVPNKEDAQLKPDNLLNSAPKPVQNEPQESKNILENVKIEKTADTKVSSNVPNSIKNKPPLPILMKGNNQKKENPEEKVIQRDILVDGKNTAEREKRDLFATNATLKQDLVIEQNKPEVKVEHESDSGFVKNIADSVKTNQSCDNEKPSKEENKIEKPLKNIDLGLETKTKPGNIPEEKPKEVEEKLILAPQKLSDPVLILEQKVPENIDLKPIAENIIKPMLRELKAADAKEQNDERKK